MDERIIFNLILGGREISSWGWDTVYLVGTSVMRGANLWFADIGVPLDLGSATPKRIRK